MKNQLANPVVKLYAFHLRNELSDVGKLAENYDHLWKRVQLLANEKYDISELRYFDNQIGFNSHYNLDGDYLELLEQGVLQFQVPNSQLRGSVYPLQIHDTFSVDISVNYQGNIDIHHLNYLTLQGFLMPNNIQANLGQTLLLYIENNGDEIQSDAALALAKKCLDSFLPQMKDKKYSLSSGTFLNSPIFEYHNYQEKLVDNLHVLIWFPSKSSLNTFVDCEKYFRHLLCSRAKILFSYSESRKSCSNLAKFYEKFKTSNQEITKLGKNLDDKLKKLKEELNIFTLDSFNFTRQLGYLEIQLTTIKNNAKNYKTYLDKLRSQNSGKKELHFLDDFHKYVYAKLAAQIRLDLAYFNTGKELYASTIASIQSIAQITQTQSDRQLNKLESDRNRDLQNMIAIVGFGVGSAQIGVSVGLDLISQERQSNPTQPYLSSPFFLLVILGLIFGAGIPGAIGGWGLTLPSTRKKFKKLQKHFTNLLPNQATSEKSFNDEENVISELETLEKTVEIQQEDCEDWYNKGNTLSKQGLFKKAIAAYDKAVEINPDDHHAWYNRGNALLGNGKLEQAVTSYNKAVEIKPDKHEAWNNQGNALSLLGKLNQAVKSYDKAVEIKPDKHEAWYNRGIILAKLGRLEEAVASYDKALSIQPDKHEAWYNRGNTLHQLGKLEEAVASYDKAVKIKPDDHKAWYNRGIALDDLALKQEAIASYDKALQIKPNDYQTWYNRGIALDDLGLKQEAIASYDKALQIKPDDYQAWYNRGITLRQLGKLEETVASYDKALHLKPDDHQAWYNRGNALGQLGKLEEAIASYNKAVEIKPDDPCIFYNKACCYALQNNIDLAIENLQQTIILNPEEYQKLATINPDFDNIRDSERFQRLICVTSQDIGNRERGMGNG